MRQRLRRHFERHDDLHARHTLHLSGLTPAEHEALSLLTGRPPRTVHSIRLDITEIDTALRTADICNTLRDALEQLDGPIVNHVAVRAAARHAWSTLTRPPDCDRRLRAWLQTPDSGALLKRFARRNVAAAENLLRQADAVMRHLPATGLTRAQLAAQTLGNAHALDSGQPVASIVLAVWRLADPAKTPNLEERLPTAADETEENAEQQSDETRLAREHARETWARAGVLVNELARPALLLNLPLRSTAAATWKPGEPAYLSLRQLVRTPPPWAVEGMSVFVCENPNLLAIAADRLGARCAPLVCTDGMPAAAQRALLTQLARAGARLHYHGDFDWPGLRIANYMIRSWQAAPWRMSASDYEAAVRTAPRRPRDLDEANVVAEWDPSLTITMRRHGLTVAEEAVAEDLSLDLQAPEPR
ncbi:MAG TPA: TIGR02679 family protein [Paraburkholderia sp.]|nr:TIGR02679 family protein [Paraburkholderia sp.]